jgi:hypothetical protein
MREEAVAVTQRAHASIESGWRNLCHGRTADTIRYSADRSGASLSTRFFSRLRSKDKGRLSAIKRIDRGDGEIILYGSEAQRFWVLMIREKTGARSRVCTALAHEETTPPNARNQTPDRRCRARAGDLKR